MGGDTLERPSLRRTSKYFWVGAAWIAILVVLMFSLSFLINVYSAQISTILVTKVDGQPNLASPGSEAFWSSVPQVSVPLIPASNYPPSGETGQAQVQLAWTDSTTPPVLIIRLQFPNLGNGPSYGSSVPVPVMNDTGYPGTRQAPMYQNSSCIYTTSSCYGGAYPQNVGFYQLAQGTAYTYPEQAAVLFGISPPAGTTGAYAVSYKPKMIPGTSGAMATGSGTAEIWLWSSSPTDNSPSDKSYPGLAFPNGTVAATSAFGLPPDTSYAMDGYANSTSFYQIGGLPGSSTFPFINSRGLYSTDPSVLQSVNQFMNPYFVQSKGVYDSATNSWTVEFVRALQTSSISKLGENAYQLQMNPASSSNYYISFAVTQGQGSETYLIYYNSVSFWWAFNFQTASGFNGYNGQYGRPGTPSS